MPVNPPKLRAAGAFSVKRRVRSSATRTARVTVLFADLRGYTGLAERIAPAAIVPLLDEFFGVLGLATAAHGGTVFHMAGDGMMAGFGTRDADDAGARRALSAGHAMLQRFGEVAKRWRRELGIETGIGVGLHLGEVAMGQVGPPGHRSTTLVGDTVNVAARLCSRARAGEVLLSYAVAAALAIDVEASGAAASGAAASGADGELYVGPIPVLHLPQYALRGRSAPLDIWCVPAAERASL